MHAIWTVVSAVLDESLILYAVVGIFYNFNKLEPQPTDARSYVWFFCCSSFGCMRLCEFCCFYCCCRPKNWCFMFHAAPAPYNFTDFVYTLALLFRLRHLLRAHMYTRKYVFVFLSLRDAFDIWLCECVCFFFLILLLLLVSSSSLLLLLLYLTTKVVLAACIYIIYYTLYIVQMWENCFALVLCLVRFFSFSIPERYVSYRPCVC